MSAGLLKFLLNFSDAREMALAAKLIRATVPMLADEVLQAQEKAALKRAKADESRVSILTADNRCLDNLQRLATARSMRLVDRVSPPVPLYEMDGMEFPWIKRG